MSPPFPSFSVTCHTACITQAEFGVYFTFLASRILTIVQEEIPVSMKQMEVTHDFEQFMLKMGPMFKFGMGKGTQDDAQSRAQTAQEKIEAVQAGESGGGHPVDGH